MANLPFNVRRKDSFVQIAWLNEYNRCLDMGIEPTAAVLSANRLLDRYNEAETQYQRQMNTRYHKVLLSASVSELAQADLSMIPANLLSHIKKMDKHPFFAVFKIGTEGISTGAGIKKVWSFGSIKELANRVCDGFAKIFHLHSNKPDDQRIPLGELIHGFVKKVGKGLEAYAVGYIKDEDTRQKIKNGEYDLCSIEAEVLFSRLSQAKEWFIDGVNKLTGLALANSQTGEKSGFDGAGVVAVIQELNSGKVTEMADGTENQGGKATIPEIDLALVQVAIARNNWRPEQLFRKDDILSLDYVKNSIETARADGKKEVETKVKQLEEELTPFKKREAASAAENIVLQSQLLTNASQKLKDYVKTRIKDFVDVTGLDEAARKTKIDAAIQAELKIVNDLKITFGDEKPADGKNQDGKQDGKKDGQQQKNTDPNDMTVAENNDLIPKDE